MKLTELTQLARRLPPLDIKGLTADSRAVKPGYLFAALPGTQVDGRTFIPKAVAAGASAVLAVPGTEAEVPVIESEEPRLTLALIAMRFFPGQPKTVAGITGTNGKTSVARFTQQIWEAGGAKAGTLGTLGAFAPGYEYALRHTTPDPIEIHQILSTMATMGTTHLAMEVSSHGLAQHRADGVQFTHAAFTNITQDHLDYHPTFEDYFQAKMRLITDLLPKDGTVVINADGAGTDRVRAETERAGRGAITVGRAGQEIVMTGLRPVTDGLVVGVAASGVEREISLPLIGAFQADNALVAAGLAVAGGAAIDDVLDRLGSLSAAPGRMQWAGTKTFPEGGEATAYVDFAHTPDAIDTALRAIRPHADGRIVIVFGAGGDRDRRKRPLMAQAAAKGADLIIVTDDNPRTEDAGAIRAEVLRGAEDAEDVGDRRAAIAEGVRHLAPGDVLLVAGKGHERGQTIGTVTYPFDDVAVAEELMREACR